MMTLIIKVSKQENTELTQVCTKTNSRLSFDNIPEDILYKICSYLQFPDLWNLGSVCSRWHRITRGEELWNRLDVTRLKLSEKQSRKLLKSLPPSIKGLKIGGHSGLKHALVLPKLFLLLERRYPQLNTLIIENAVLAKSYKKFSFVAGFMLNGKAPRNQQIRRHFSVVKYDSAEAEDELNSLVCLLHNVTVLSFRNTILAPEDIFPVGDAQMTASKIKVLDLTNSPCARDETIKLLSRLPLLEELYLPGTPITVNGVLVIMQEVRNLKILDLEDTIVGGETFEVLRLHGQSLVEIYLGRSAVTDLDLNCVDEGDFPALRQLCLVHTEISEVGVNRLLFTLPSLACVDITCCQVDFQWLLDQPVSEREKQRCDESAFCHHFLANKFKGGF